VAEASHLRAGDYARSRLCCAATSLASRRGGERSPRRFPQESHGWLAGRVERGSLGAGSPAPGKRRSNRRSSTRRVTVPADHYLVDRLAAFCSSKLYDDLSVRTYATKVRKDHGLEAAQILLGHSRADVTQVYAERDEAKAINVARKIG